MSSLDVRAIDTKDLPKAKRPGVRRELEVFIAEAAFDRAVERGTKDTSREIGGVLVGEVRHDERGPFLVIEDTIDALHADEKGAELTFTHDTWEHIHKEMDTRFADKKLVGWYHTHPGFGVFLSDRDQFIHKSFFNLPFQVALVYDPKSKEHGVFAWRDGDVWRLRRYAIGEREHTWDGNRAAARPAEAKDKPEREVERPRRDRRDDDEDDRIGSFGTFLMFAVVLIIIAGFGGYWLGGSRGGVDPARLNQALLQAKFEGADEALKNIQGELVGVLRDTLADDAIHRPALAAIEELDRAIARLAPAPGQAPDPRAADLAAALAASRERLVAVSRSRVVAEQMLATLEAASRQTSALRADVVREVADQRAGLGQLYAELAADVGKTDRARGRRLLITAARLDPGNRGRYQDVLVSFAPGEALPRDPSAPPAPRPAPATSGVDAGVPDATITAPPAAPRDGGPR